MARRKFSLVLRQVTDGQLMVVIDIGDVDRRHYGVTHDAGSTYCQRQHGRRSKRMTRSMPPSASLTSASKITLERHIIFSIDNPF